MTIEQAKSELMQMYGALAPNKQIAIDMLIKASVKSQESQIKPKGHWIDNNNGTISCSYCHTWFYKDDRYSYMHCCPNCGDKMESEVEE